MGNDRPENYDWLYGTSNQGIGQSASPTSGPGPADPEPTRILARPIAAGSGSAGQSEQPTQAEQSDPATRTIAPPPGPPGNPGLAGAGDGNGGGKPARKKRRFRPVRIVLLLVLLWLVYLVAVPIFAFRSIEKVDADPGKGRPGEQPGTTYLLVGSDSREGLTKAQRKRLSTGGATGRRTDTIMVMHIGSGPNLLISIPRDSLVEVPGHGVTKINAAYAYGGPQLLVQTIENNTGIRIDNYVEIGFGGFVNLVNAVGGITICPKTAMTDPLAGLDIKAGCQPANGKKALGYARSRYVSALGDIDRAAHQREVVAQVGSRAMSPMTVLNPIRYYELAFAASDSLTVGKNVGPIDMARFAMAMRNVDGDDALTCGVPISDLAVHWDTERANRLFQLIQNDRTEEVGKNLCRPSGLPR